MPDRGISPRLVCRCDTTNPLYKVQCCLGLFLRLCLVAVTALAALAQNAEDEYRVYTAHPRLFLRPQRLRLLQRERPRQSLRWRQFEMLVAGKITFPEPGFALALYYAVSADAEVGRQAVAWALRQAA